jgi:MFS family permease
LLATAVVSLLLATVWGGVDFPWLSVQILGLFSTSALATLLFILRERVAKEPIITLSLFKNDIFRVSTILAVLVGMVMFGALIFLPEYQQIVRGDTATKSGLMLLPLVAGMMTASITSGRLMSKFGRYRPFPIIGMTVVSLSFWLFSHIAVDTSRVWLGVWMAILGIGVGLVMPVLTLAVQNAVERKDMGTATSTVTFARSIGSALGAAIFGAIITSRLTHHLLENLPAEQGQAAASTLKGSAASLQHLPPEQLHTVLVAFSSAFHDVFLFGIPFAVAAFIATLFLRESPLRGAPSAEAKAESLNVS